MQSAASGDAASRRTAARFLTVTIEELARALSCRARSVLTLLRESGIRRHRKTYCEWRIDGINPSEVASDWDFRRVDTSHAFQGMQCRHPRDRCSSDHRR